jgi:TetR/AcrR family transcriptional regulator, transcriptional repressor for nem operon
MYGAKETRVAMEESVKKRTRDPVKTRTHILSVAFSEIFQRGFQGVSIDEIIAQTEVTKGAFFHYFSTKQDLGYAIVDEILKDMTLNRWIRPLAAYKNPVSGIIRQLKKIIDDTTEEQMALGCPLNNLIQEMSSVDPVFRDKLNVVLTLWIDEIEKYLKKAREEGYVKRTVDTRQAAEFIVTLHEGGFGIAKSMRDKKIWFSLYGSLRKYLESISENAASL